MKKGKVLSLFFLLLLVAKVNAQIFKESVLSEKAGQFPRHWDLISGMALVDQIEGKSVINIQHGGIIKPIVSGKENDYLSGDFTLEFDAFFDQASNMTGQRYEIRLWQGAYDYNQNNIKYAPFTIARNGLKTTWSTPEYGNASNYFQELETLSPVWRHIKVEYANGGLKIFMDDRLLLQFPRFKIQPTMLSIGGGINESKVKGARLGITNVVISNGQEELLVSEDGCGVVPSEDQLRIMADPNSLFNRRLAFLQEYSIEDLRGLPAVPYINGKFMLPQQVRFSTTPTEKFTVVPLAIHIVRKSDRTGGISTQEVISIVNDSNKIFGQYGVTLTIDKLKYIYDDTIFDTTYVYGDKVDEEVDIIDMTRRNIPNKINVYFVPKTTSEQGLSYSWSSFPDVDPRDQHVLIKNGSGEKLFVHEIGHWFNLYHTHQKDKEGGVEFVDGSNCDTDGDFVCDTPADPKLSSENVDNCLYTGASKDPNGDSYLPDPSNFMSYAPGTCRSNFTEEQVKRMYNSYLGMQEDRGYTFEYEPQVGRTVQFLELGSGWKGVGMYEMNGKSYLLFFNETSSQLKIRRINSDGTVGLETDSKDFQGDLSFVGVRRVATKRFIYLINYSSGELGMISLNNDGTFGGGQSYQVGTGWSYAHIHESANDFILLSSSANRKSVNYSLGSDGRLGAKLWESSGLFFLEGDQMVSIGEKGYKYSKATGQWRDLAIKDDGKIDVFVGAYPSLDQNLTATTYVPGLGSHGENVNSLMTLDQSSGQVKKYYIRSNSTVGEVWYDNAQLNSLLPPGFDTITPFNFFSDSIYRSYVMLSSSSTGEIRIFRLDQMI